MFKAAGVPLPDDTTWTWDDYTQICREITAKSPEGVYGCSAYGGTEAELQRLGPPARRVAVHRGRQLGVSPGDGDRVLPAAAQVAGHQGQPAGVVQHRGGDRPARPVRHRHQQARHGLLVVQPGQGAGGRVRLEPEAAAPAQRDRQATEHGMYYKSSMFWSTLRAERAPAGGRRCSSTSWPTTRRPARDRRRPRRAVQHRDPRGDHAEAEARPTLAPRSSWRRSTPDISVTVAAAAGRRR